MSNITSSDVNALFDKFKARPSGYGYKPSVRERRLLKAALSDERRYFAKLRKIVKHIQEIIEAFWDNTTEATIRVREQLRQYSQYITPWATAVSRRMHVEINARDLRDWEDYTKRMSVAIQKEVRETQTGDILRKLLSEQVHLIKSIPLEAAERVHQLTMEGMIKGLREEDVREAVMRTGQVTQSRAQLIARTEVARTRSLLTQARAMKIGSEGYIWRTVGDATVRPSHRKLEGTFQRWDSPPLCDEPDHYAHPGQIFNCRCRPVPVLPWE